METKVEKILHDKKLKKTDTRTRVLEAFLNSNNALSNHDLENNFDYVDRVTLYRTIKTFEEKGIIHQASDGTEVPKYALCAENCSAEKHHDSHAHFTCTQCDSTICLEDVEINEISLPNAYKLDSAKITLSGQCAQCS